MSPAEIGAVDIGAADLGLVGVTLLVLVLPGAVVGLAAGLRGWQLAAAGPLLTYAVAGLAGPTATGLGVAWSPGVLALATLVAAALGGAVAALGHALGGAAGRPAPRPRAADTALAATVMAAGAAGAAAVLGGLRRLSTIPQDWDAVFHANGIRWIAETGDAGLFGMSRVNWYEGPTRVFYPNAYHLLGATVRQLTGADVVPVLNAHTVLVPGLAALVLAVLVRRLGGSTLHAAGTALAAVAVTAPYDNLWRGPLLPYTAGVALTPVVVVAAAEFLDARGGARLPAGLVLALAVAGLVCLHPAMLFGAAVLGLGFVVWRWARRPAALLREPALLLLAGAAGLALAHRQIAGSFFSAASFPPADWPADLAGGQAVGQLLTFAHTAATGQLALTVLAAVGLATLHRLGGLQWVLVPLAVFGTLFVLAAASDAPWVNAITRPWWNDRYRLVAVFALLAAVLVGHGLVGVARGAAAAGRRLARRGVPAARARPAVVGALVLAAFVAVTGGLEVDRNARRVAWNTGEGPALSSAEVAGLAALADVVPPGVRVLNDRGDGSVWMYALAGVLPTAGHYDGTDLGGTDVALLEARFAHYATEPAVRRAVERLGVGYVVVADGFLRGDARRAPGLRGLGRLPFLHVVARNRDVVVYRIVGRGAARPAPAARAGTGAVSAGGG